MENTFKEHEIQVKYLKCLRKQGSPVVDNGNFARENKKVFEISASSKCTYDVVRSEVGHPPCGVSILYLKDWTGLVWTGLQS